MDNTFDLLELNQKYRMQIIALRNQAINLESAIGENEKKYGNYANTNGSVT